MKSRRTALWQPEGRARMGITYVTQEDIRQWVTPAAKEAGLTFEEFIVEGKAGTLIDGNLLDHWLMYGDLIDG